MSEIERKNTEHQNPTTELKNAEAKTSSTELKSSAKQWVAQKASTFLALLNYDEKIVDNAISQGLDINLEEKYRELYSDLVTLSDQTIDLSRLTDKQVDQLEEQRNLQTEPYVGITAADFINLPTMTQRNLLERHSFSRKQIEYWLEGGVQYNGKKLSTG